MAGKLSALELEAEKFLEEINWTDDYNVGEAVVDNAHRRLFSVLRRVLTILKEKDDARNRNICREAVKFLEAYTVQHFAEEEAFQKKIGYAGYKMHKALHDNLRQVTLPSLKDQLEKNDYSHDAIDAFIGIFTGWLTGHVMVEDQAITGKMPSRWSHDGNDDDIDNLDREMRELMTHVFHTEVKLANRHYAGETLTKGIFCRMNFKGTEDSQYEVVVFAEEPVIFLLAGGILGKKVFQVEKTAFLSYLQLIQSMSIRVVHMLYPESEAVLSGSSKESEVSLRDRFKNGYPDVSVLWRVPEGRIGMCVEKVK